MAAPSKILKDRKKASSQNWIKTKVKVFLTEIVEQTQEFKGVKILQANKNWIFFKPVEGHAEKLPEMFSLFQLK